MKIDWKKKLTSRKFWAAVVGFVTAVLAVVGLGDNEIAQIVAIITAGATLIAYIIGEGMVDAANAGSSQTPEAPVDERAEAFYKEVTGSDERG